VSAVFVCNFAQTRLDAPRNPPLSQQDLLATALQPIVSFVVLGSILTHGLSIPFFSVGRRILAISRSLVVDQPDWLRRDAPQVDTERAVHAGEDASGIVTEEPQEWQKGEESPGLSDLAGSAPEGFKTPRGAVKIDIPRTSEKQDIVVIQECVGITVSEEAKTAHGDK